MAEFGYHPGTNPSTFDNPSNNVLFCKSPNTPTGSGISLTAISVFCKILAGSPTFKVGIYADSSGAPGSKIADSGATTGTPAASAAYVSVACSASLTSGTQYWPTVLVPNGASTPDMSVGFDTNGGLTELFFISNGVPGGSSFPGSGAGASSAPNERMAVFCTYTATPTGPVAHVLAKLQAIARASQWTLAMQVATRLEQIQAESRPKLVLTF
jgi:hypothetical protein